MELAAQSFTERAAREVHQPHCPPGAANRDLVAGCQLADDLAIGAQDGGGPGADDLHVNPGVQGQDEGAIGQGVRANRRESQDLGRGEYDRAPAASE